MQQYEKKKQHRNLMEFIMKVDIEHFGYNL